MDFLSRVFTAFCLSDMFGARKPSRAKMLQVAVPCGVLFQFIYFRQGSSVIQLCLCFDNF